MTDRISPRGSDLARAVDKRADAGKGAVSKAGSRRSFLADAGFLGAAGAIGGVLLTPSTSRAQDPNAAFNLQFQDIQRHTNAHVAALIEAVTNAGGTPRPKPVFRDVTAESYDDFLLTLKTVKNASIGSHLRTLQFVFDAQVRLQLSAIAFIEARHGGWLNAIVASNVRRITANAYGLEQTFERPLTRAEVINFVLPFVQNLNGGPAFFYGDYSNATNDVNILNFALALCYLEQEILNINVPVYHTPA